MNLWPLAAVPLIVTGRTISHCRCRGGCRKTHQEQPVTFNYCVSAWDWNPNDKLGQWSAWWSNWSDCDGCLNERTSGEVPPSCLLPALPFISCLLGFWRDVHLCSLNAHCFPIASLWYLFCVLHPLEWSHLPNGENILDQRDWSKSLLAMEAMSTGLRISIICLVLCMIYGWDLKCFCRTPS